MQFNNRKSGVAIHLIIVKLKTTNTLRDDLIYNNRLVYHCKKLTPTTRGRPQVSPYDEANDYILSFVEVASMKVASILNITTSFHLKFFVNSK
jgi:hypothetical protein